MTWYHGGVAGLKVGDEVVPSPPHVTDGCPVCVARSEGRAATVGEFRTWLAPFGERARPILDAMADAPDEAPMDPPSEIAGVYVTTDERYAAWYAARSGHGDLYEVVPLGEMVRSETDRFPTMVADRARVRRVVRRHVWLTRHERRVLSRAWAKADQRGALADAAAGGERGNGS